MDINKIADLLQQLDTTNNQLKDVHSPFLATTLRSRVYCINEELINELREYVRSNM